MRREHVEQRQRAHDVVLFREQQLIAQPAIVDHPRIPVLRHLGHTRRAAGMEIGAHPVPRGIREIERGVLPPGLGHEILDVGMVLAGHFRPQEGHDPAFRRAEIGVQVDLEDRVHLPRMAHRLGGFLGDIRLREGFQRHHHLGVGLAQDGADILGLEQRVDRAGDAGHHGPHHRRRGLQAVGQDQGNHVALLHLERAEEVRRLAHLLVKLPPCQRLRRVTRAGKELVADGRAVRKGLGHLLQHLVQRFRPVPLLPRHLVLNVENILTRGKTHCRLLPSRRSSDGVRRHFSRRNSMKVFGLRCKFYAAFPRRSAHSGGAAPGAGPN